MKRYGMSMDEKIQHYKVVSFFYLYMYLLHMCDTWYIKMLSNCTYSVSEVKVAQSCPTFRDLQEFWSG